MSDFSDVSDDLTPKESHHEQNTSTGSRSQSFSSIYGQAIDPNLARMLREHAFVQVQRGGKILQRGPAPCTARRSRKDCCWAAAFWVALILYLFTSSLNRHETTLLVNSWDDDPDAHHAFANILSLMRWDFAAIGGLSSMTTFFAIMWGMFRVPQLVVSCVICLGIAAMMLIGMILVTASCEISGWFIICSGIIVAACMWSYRNLLPFTIELMLVVNRTVVKHPNLLTIQLCGALLHWFWMGVSACNISAAIRLLDKFAEDDSPEHSLEYCAYLLTFIAWVAAIWVFNVIGDTCYMAACGVYCRWYLGWENTWLPRRTRSSLWVACTTSFGSVCFYAAVGNAVSVVRTMLHFFQNQIDDSQHSEYFLAGVMHCLKEVIVACVGDTIDWFSKFAFVQCAMRGFRFFDAVQATYSLCTLSSVENIRDANFVSSMCFIAAWVCCLMGGLTSVAWGWYKHHDTTDCFLVGSLFGWLVGRQVLLTLDSGATTIIICWSENAAVLAHSYPKLHSEFCQRADCWQTAVMGDVTGRTAHGSPEVGAVEMRAI